MKSKFLLMFLGICIAGSAHSAPQSSPELLSAIEPLTTGENPYRGVAAIKIQNSKIDFANSGVDQISSDSIVEIGSVTKVFTSLLLAIASQQSVLKLDQSLNQSFAEQLLAPELNNSITLQQLSQQSAGLPRLPDNLPMTNPEDPYLGFDLKLLKDFLRSLEWRNPMPTDCVLAHQKDPNDYSDIFGHTIRRPGSCYNYSNIGVSILGHAVAKSFNTTYENAVATEITTKLGLQDTVFELSAQQSPRKIQGYNGEAKPVAEWSRDAVNPSGGLKSTPTEMIGFLRLFLKSDANSDPTLKSSAELTLSTIASIPTADGEQLMGLGWHVFKYQERNIYWHNGGTSGFLSFAAIDPQNATAVFVVANQVLDERIDQAGFKILIGND